MDNKINTALDRLDSILPLLSGLESLNDDDTTLYCKLIKNYLQQGRTLTRQEIGKIVNDADISLNNIVNSKLIVLDEDGNPSGAYPFTSEEREHKVHIDGVTVHCMCALDSLAVSPMFNIPTAIDSRCRVTDKNIHIEQNGTELDDDTMEVWLGIDWGAAAADSVCAASLCLEMMFLANKKIAEDWLSESADTREIFDIQSAVEFASAFFVPIAMHCQQSE